MNMSRSLHHHRHRYQKYHSLTYTHAYTPKSERRFSLYRQLGIPPSTGQRLQNLLNKGPYDGDIPRELANGDQEVAEEDEETVQLDYEPGERPAEEDEEDSGGEGGGAFEFLPAREEGEGLFEADY